MYYNEIKERVTAGEAAEYYGIETNFAGFSHCIFHSENTASMKFFSDSGRFYCFGCGASGDSIDLVAQLFGTSRSEAAVKLNSDFHLGCPMERKATLSERYEQREKERERKERKKRQEEDRARLFDAYYSAIDKVISYEKNIKRYKPIECVEKLHPKFVEAIVNLPLAQLELEEAESEVINYELRRHNNSRHVTRGDTE